MNNDIYMIAVNAFHCSEGYVFYYVGLDNAIKRAKSLSDPSIANQVHVYKTHIDTDGRIVDDRCSDEGCVFEWRSSK